MMHFEKGTRVRSGSQECETGTYSLSYDYGCGLEVCESRKCIPCPDGATCNKGSSEPWTHFVP